MKKRFMSAASVLLVIVMLLNGCAGFSEKEGEAENNNSETVEEGGTSKESVVIRLMRDPDSCFTGEYANQNTQDPVEHMVVESLTQENYADKKVIDPLLAKSWEADEDGMGVTFYLRDDVYFHNGEKMTADDVVYSYATLAAQSSQAAVYPWIDFAGTKKVDDLTVYVPMNEYNITWEDDLQFVGIYCKSYTEENKDNSNLYMGDCIGTGPYKIESWTTNDSVVLTKNEDYWGEEAIIDNVTFRVISEMSVALMELQTGGIDALFEADYVDAQEVNNDSESEFRVYEQLQQLQAFLGFNMHSEKVSDIRVRQAVCMAIDREALIQGTFDGAGYVPYCVVPEVAESVHYWEEEDFPLNYDPEQAKALLKEAGAENLELTILADSNDPLRKGAAEQIANMLEQVGVTLNIKLLDGTVMGDTLVNETEEYDLFVRRNGGSPAPGGVAATIINNIGNKCHHDDSPITEEMMDILTEVTQTADDEKRLELWEEYQLRFPEEWLSYFPYQSGDSYVICSKNLENVKWNTFVYNINEWYFS